MRLALAEVYEVATFYHHFEVVKEGRRRRLPSPCGSVTPSRAIWPARNLFSKVLLLEKTCA